MVRPDKFNKDSLLGHEPRAEESRHKQGNARASLATWGEGGRVAFNPANLLTKSPRFYTEHSEGHSN